MAAYSLSELERSGIYQIRNKDSGKRYIGSAKVFRIRWNSHRAKLVKGTHHSPHLQASWTKNGPNSFEFEILEFCEMVNLIEREQHWIDNAKPEFNVCPTAGSTLGRRHSEKTRAKIRAKKEGLKLPPRTPEYCEAVSKRMKGRQKTPEHMAALQAGRIAALYTPERLAKLSASLKDAYATGKRSRQKSEEHKNKIGMFYAKLSDDQIREIRALRASGVTGRELASRFGSNAGTISEICSRKRYRWVFD